MGFRWPFGRTDRQFDVRNHTVFISGGSRGLGLELARVFGMRGSRVAISGRDADEVERAKADLVARGIRACGVVADMRVKEENEHALALAQDELGPIAILVNNAGTIVVGPLENVTEDDYRDAMDTHFWAPLFAVNALKPAMRARRSGRIVNIASIGGRLSVPHLLPYCASKFALVGFSEGLRAELVRDRVYVTTVIPGLMRTGSPENAHFKGRNRLEYGWFSISDSLPFLSVDVTEAAQAIVDACQRGDAELTISLPARCASFFHGILPAPVTELMGIAARLLPSAGGISNGAARGRESHSAVSPSPLTAASQARVRTQNQEAG